MAPEVILCGLQQTFKNRKWKQNEFHIEKVSVVLENMCFSCKSGQEALGCDGKCVSHLGSTRKLRKKKVEASRG